MRILIPLFFAMLVFSCGSTRKISECASKAPKIKSIEALPKLDPSDHNIFNIKIVYYVLADVVDTAAVESAIVEGHDIANKLFGEAFNFQMHPFILYSNVDINIDQAINRKDKLRDKLDLIEEFNDVISVFILEDSKSGLLGFTNVFPTCKDCYTKLAPKYDYIIASMDGITNYATVAHELGHFFGLGHPFSASQDELKAYGLTTSQLICVNLMNYSCCAREKTGAQIGIMWNYCGMHRHNLITIDKIEYP